MLSAASSLTSASAIAAAQSTEAGYQDVLNEMIGIGLQLLRELPQRDADPDASSVRDTAADYERISRSVRRSILLAQKLAAGSDGAAGRHRASARRRIIRAVEDAIEREAPEPQAEALHAELAERLDSPELEDDLDSRPVDEIIDEIRHDLGLGSAGGWAPWKRRTPDQLAGLASRAARPTPSVSAGWQPALVRADDG